MRNKIFIILVLFINLLFAQNNSQFVSQTTPTNIDTNQVFSYTVSFNNTGTTTWTVGNYYVGTINPYDNTTWGVTNRVTIPYDVAPGETMSVTINLTAPSTSGFYNLQWRMIDTVTPAWFGENSTNINVPVHINASEFISQSVLPSFLDLGETFNVSISFKNTGTTTWTTADNYKLGAHNPQDNTNWGLTRLYLPYDVAPGQTVTFNTTLTATLLEGIYNFEWKMVQDGVEWFGDNSTTVVIPVGITYIMNGSTSENGTDCYQVTTGTVASENGSIWYSEKIDLTKPFDINFSMEMTHGNNGGTDADGMMFVLQNSNDGYNALGGAGAALGYAGILPSLGIEFDIYDNRHTTGWDNNTLPENVNDTDWDVDHIAISSGGDVTCDIALPVYAIPGIPDIVNEGEKQVRITWDPTYDSLCVYFNCLSRIRVKYDIINNTFGGVSKVYWGFTGSTGEFDWTNQTVCLDENIFTAVEDKNICFSDSVKLDVKGSSISSHIWSPNYNIDDITLEQPTVWPDHNTTYYVTYTHPCGDERTDSVQVIVNHTTAQIIGRNEICAFDSIEIAFTGVPDWNYEITNNNNPYLSGTTSNDTIKLAFEEFGTYLISDISDNTGCNADILGIPEFTVNQLPTINITPNNYSEICYNDTILIDASTSTGNGNLIYEWSTLSDSSRINVWPTTDSTFYLTVADTNSCISYDTITIIVNPLPSFGTPTITPVTNCVNPNGEITIIGLGASPNLQYNMNNGAFSSNNTFTNIDGAPLFGIMNSKGCINYEYFSIPNNQGLDIDTVYFDEIKCYNDSNSTVSIYTIDSGNNIYYSIDGGTTSQADSFFTNIGAGTYPIYIIDSITSCIASNILTITQPTELTNYFIKYDVTCYGDNSGSAVANYNGGTLPYSSISGDFSLSSDSIYNLYSDTIYTIQIIDNNDCILNDTFSISQPTELVITSVNKTDILCYNNSNGSISLGVDGGISPYSYLWSNNDTLSTTNNLETGYYDVTVTDSYNCETLTDSIFLSNPPELILDTIATKNLTCFQSENGEIEFEVNGGTGTYIYFIDSTQVYNTSINTMPAGLHLIYAIDENNCTVKDTFVLTQPELLTISDSINENNIFVQANGGTPEYYYNWDNGETTQILTSLTTGTYIITVTDKNNCEITNTFIIEEPFFIPTVITPNADNYNDTWEIKGLLAYEKIAINIFNRWGDKVYSFDGSGVEYNDKSKQWDGIYKGKKLPLGTYVYIIEIDNILEKYNGTVTIIR